MIPRNDTDDVQIKNQIMAAIMKILSFHSTKVLNDEKLHFLSKNSIEIMDWEDEEQPLADQIVMENPNHLNEPSEAIPELGLCYLPQKPYAIRDFPRGLYEVRESSSARDSSYVGGLAPWALRRDLETEKERELLNHDLENVKRALGNVLERVSVLESRENATLKKRLAETETKLAWACMEEPPSDDEDTKLSRTSLLELYSIRWTCKNIAANSYVLKARMRERRWHDAGGDGANGTGAGSSGSGCDEAGGAEAKWCLCNSRCAGAGWTQESRNGKGENFATATSLIGRAYDLVGMEGIATMGIDAANGNQWD
ncbi:hypothetical protein Tco_1302621 [Tanacetum coccineum]